MQAHGSKPNWPNPEEAQNTAWPEKPLQASAQNNISILLMLGLFIKLRIQVIRE